MPRPRLIDVSSAQALAREYCVDLSRPTIIKYAKEGLGHQIGGKGGKWLINQEKFRRFLRGENQHTIEEETGEEAPAVNEVDSNPSPTDREEPEEEEGDPGGGTEPDSPSNSILSI